MKNTLLPSTAALLLAVLSTAAASANPEPAVLSDGRSVAMGGTGVASNDYATAPYHNPAGLAAVKAVSATLTFTPILGKVRAPFPDATGQPVEYDSNRSLAPLTTLAAGVRVHERVAIGVIGFLTAGSGAVYSGAIAGRDAKGLAFAGEAQIPVAVTITDRLSIGAAYRITAARLELDAPAPVPPPAVGFADTTTKISGTNYTGFSLGARYKVSDDVRVGFLYRSKVVVDLNGYTNIDFAGTHQAVDAKGEFPVPHTFKLGSEFDLFEKKLTLAVDAAYWMYSNSNDEKPSVGRTAAWNDAFAGIVGLEYHVTESVPVRVGTNIGNSATSKKAATPFGLPPGMIYTFTAGTGLHVSPFDFDLGMGYVLQSGATVSPSENPTGAGKYSGNAYVGSVSASLRL